MKFEQNEIIEIPEFLSAYDNSVLLKHLFDVKELWETQRKRVPDYKNGVWYSLGASCYLDITKKEDWEPYKAKVKYFNSILSNNFGNLYKMLLLKLSDKTGERFDMAYKLYDHLALPGFHIFPPHLALTEFFGRKHRDLQWSTLEQMPDFNFKMEDHFSGTYTIKIPRGPHLLYGENLETPLTYKERAMYLHSGNFDHAIAPLQNPVTIFDYRITLQFHGFKCNGVNHVYW